MARSINRERFSAAVEALRAEPVQHRLVDVLLPLRAEFVALRNENRTYLELWRVVTKADVECTYPNFVRAMKQILSDRVQPLAEARARTRARRAAARALPAVPMSLRPSAAASEPVPLPASPIASSGDPYQQQATRQVAASLLETFGKTPKK